MSQEVRLLEIIIDGITYNSIDDVPFEMQDACKMLLQKMDNSDEGSNYCDELPQDILEKMKKMSISRTVSNKSISFSKNPDSRTKYKKVNSLFRKHEKQVVEVKSDLKRKTAFVFSVLGLIYYFFIMMF